MNEDSQSAVNRFVDEGAREACVDLSRHSRFSGGGVGFPGMSPSPGPIGLRSGKQKVLQFEGLAHHFKLTGYQGKEFFYQGEVSFSILIRVIHKAYNLTVPVSLKYTAILPSPGDETVEGIDYPVRLKQFVE